MALLEIFNFLHFIGLAYGLGGATIATIISIKADKDVELGKQVMKIIPSISKLIWFGLLLLIISGIGISFLVSWPVNKQLLIVKHVLVVWIIIFGIVIGFKVKKLKKLAPKSREQPSIQFLKTKKQLKFFSIINLLLWYLIILLSVFA